MIQTFLRQARADEPVWLPEVRAAFQAEGTRRLRLRVTGCDRAVYGVTLSLPQAHGEDQAQFLAEYVHASLYNILSVRGAAEVEVYVDQADAALTALARGLEQVFQVQRPKQARTGYGMCLNVNDRVLAALSGGREHFSLRVRDLREAPAEPEPEAVPVREPVFASLPGRTQGKLLLGMDIGGTDVKLAVSVDGRLALCKEFDWLPSASTRVEELTGPLLLLTRLLRAAGSLSWAGREDAVVWEALDRQASLAAMEQAAAAMEQAAGMALRGFDAIGLSFPDVVIQNRIVGGETPKTIGLRNNRALDYEAQFAQLTALNEALESYTIPGGPVRVVNDGPMAAFTAAVEQAAGGAELAQGFFAHSLGTDLGTGWVRPDGSIPDIPLEAYNCILDLGSWDQRRLPPQDVRSNCSMNTGLPGALQKYAGQSAVFRLAARQAPEAVQAALDRGLFRLERDGLYVPTAPEDRRKECLAFFMERAEWDPDCAGIFRAVGACLAAATQELDFILRPEARERMLFGRMVMRSACFELLCQGAAQQEPSLKLRAASGDLANTSLMRQLDQRPDCTVAQFAQAVGAIYYSVAGT